MAMRNSEAPNATTPTASQKLAVRDARLRCPTRSGIIPVTRPASGRRCATASAHPVEADLLIDLLGVGPVFIDLDVDEQMDLEAEQLAQFLARCLADGLDSGAALAE